MKEIVNLCCRLNECIQRSVWIRRRQGGAGRAAQSTFAGSHRQLHISSQKVPRLMLYANMVASRPAEKKTHVNLRFDHGSYSRSSA